MGDSGNLTNTAAVVEATSKSLSSIKLVCSAHKSLALIGCLLCKSPALLAAGVLESDRVDY